MTNGLDVPTFCIQMMHGVRAWIRSGTRSRGSNQQHLRAVFHESGLLWSMDWLSIDQYVDTMMNTQ